MEVGVANRNRCLVEESTTVGSVAEAGDLLVLLGELVVVADLLAAVDGPLRVDHDALRALRHDHFCVAVRLTRMVDEACEVSHSRSVDHLKCRYASY